MPSLDLWANLIRGVGKTETPVRDLPRSLCISKRAVKTRIGTANRKGWIIEAKSAQARVTVCLTEVGSSVAASWTELQARVEEQTRARLGINAYDGLRGCLQTIIAMSPLEYPHYPAAYGPADASVTGGNGRDWSAVVREPGDTVSHLPLSALVSQAIVAFAMRYEDSSPVAFALAASIISRIAPEGRPVSEIRDPVGLSALTRHGFLNIVQNKRTKLAVLTSRGQAVRANHKARVDTVEREWEDSFGSQNITRLRAILEEVELRIENAPELTRP